MKIVIWLQLNQNGGGVGYLNPALNILARLYGEVVILGLIAPQGITFNGIKNISKEDLKNIDYDLILVAGQNASLVPILQDAETLGIDEDKIILDRVACIPLFTLEKYNKLRRSKLSILSFNCFGGYLYNALGLKFLSPTINMFTHEKDFLEFLKDPIINMNKELVFKEMSFFEPDKKHYPLFMIGDTPWHMLHYNDADTAFKKWYQRRYKINWFNLFVVMCTEKPEILSEFDKLPFSKKACFVPFKTDLDSGFYIDSSKYPQYSRFVEIFNAVAYGAVHEYDIWDMLLYGKKTPLIIK